MFEEFINEIVSIVQSTEQRRERSETDKVSFSYAIEYLLKDIVPVDTDSVIPKLLMLLMYIW